MLLKSSDQGWLSSIPGNGSKCHQGGRGWSETRMIAAAAPSAGAEPSTSRTRPAVCPSCEQSLTDLQLGHTPLAPNAQRCPKASEGRSRAWALTRSRTQNPGWVCAGLSCGGSGFLAGSEEDFLLLGCPEAWEFPLS